MEKKRKEFALSYSVIDECHHCNGMGYIVKKRNTKTCPWCMGSGHTEHYDKTRPPLIECNLD